MKNFSKILSEISKLIREIETDYPELYKYLDENPITIPNEAHPKVDDVAMDNYLRTLKTILKKYKEEHLIKTP